MTSSSFRSRTLRSGSAIAVLSLLISASAPLAAQDLRDIPQKSTPPAKKQGREVQGPPAPLETQLRDTPPDEPVFRSPAAPVPTAPPIVRTDPVPNNAAPKQQPTKTNPATKTAPATRPTTERAPAPGARGAAAAVGAAPDSRNATPREALPGTGLESGAPLTPDASTPSLTPNTGPTTGTGAVSPDITVDDASPATPASDTGSTLPWALGGAALLGLGGLAYAWRRRRAVAATGAPAFGGIELGQTPFADELNSGDNAAAPIAKSLQAPKPKPASKPAQPVQAPAPQPAPPPPPPAPVKASSDGRIVSRIRAQVPDGVENMPPPVRTPEPPRAAPPPPPAPVKPAADGRIVSRLKVSDVVDEPPPPPAPPPRRRRAIPAVKSVSVGYSVNKRD